jgi:ubiquinone/menaquinone biosynthesis C-methylase UbiE
MEAESRRAHWETVYASKSEREVSWFQESAAPSLELIAEAGVTPLSAIIDVGGGASRLVDALLEKGFRDVTVLDISEAALGAAKARLSERGLSVRWVISDVTEWRPEAAAFDLWHDRAAFHFLTDPGDRTAYVARMIRALKPGGHAIIATFALDGPERCSGLPVQRYDGRNVGEAIGERFELIRTRPEVHTTPWGAKQSFQFSLFRFCG